MRRPLERRGFTMVEMLLVLVLIGLISVVAYPALSTFNARNADAAAATKVSRLINRVKDQARRRNRAYLLTFEAMNDDQPQGRMSIREATSTSCSLATVDATRLLSQVPFGATLVAGYTGARTPDVGLAGWQQGDGDLQAADLTLCASPSGALAVGVGAQAVPLAGQLEVHVQLFEPGGGGWRLKGPARVVELTYAGNARLGLN